MVRGKREGMRAFTGELVVRSNLRRVGKKGPQKRSHLEDH